MNRLTGIVAVAACWVCAPALSQDITEPRLGYCYPAGGQRGTVVRLLAGGQLLNGVKEVLVSGTGVRATVVRYLGRTLRLSGQERQEVVRRLKELKNPPEKKAEETVKLPDHPLLNNLAKLSPMEMDFLVNEFLRPDKKRQPNAQIGETALIEVTIDAEAAPGDREIRLKAALGLTNPMVFQVGAYPEILEPTTYDATPGPTPVADLPAIWNGQIMPGDIDRVRFRAKEGQNLVMRLQARRLVPFIADAVPGWFQATLALYDAKGKEAAFADDYRFESDPVLLVKVPATGEYELEIRDALYRGREDFVYRLIVAEQPFITSHFPLGGRAGEDAVAIIKGWNLTEGPLPLDTKSAGGPIRQTAWRKGDALSNDVAYAVDTLPECLEAESNDRLETAQLIELPRIVNGRIDRPGDEDAFRFEGKAGKEVVVEVIARRLQSPLDSLLRLTDANGKVLAWNDDFEHREGDLRTDVGDDTHHADSYIRFKFPRDGTYHVRVSDAQRQGGEAFAYRLRVSPPRPDFQLAMTPSTINIRGGIAVPISVHVLRIDGFDGPITLSLKDPPAGFKLQGAVIPAGKPSVRLTMTLPMKASETPVTLHLVGTGTAGERSIMREAVPCDDSMQAFLWRHLLPGGDLVVSLVGFAGRVAPPEIVGNLPVQLPRGGTVEVQFKVDLRKGLESVQLDLDEPPKGVLLEKFTLERDLLKLVFKVETDHPGVGAEGNLIVQIYTDVGGKSKDGKPARGKRLTVGVLPAIPFKVVMATE